MPTPSRYQDPIQETPDRSSLRAQPVLSGQVQRSGVRVVAIDPTLDSAFDDVPLVQGTPSRGREEGLTGRKPTPALVKVLPGRAEIDALLLEVEAVGAPPVPQAGPVALHAPVRANLPTFGTRDISLQERFALDSPEAAAVLSAFPTTPLGGDSSMTHLELRTLFFNAERSMAEVTPGDIGRPEGSSPATKPPESMRDAADAIVAELKAKGLVKETSGADLKTLEALDQTIRTNFWGAQQLLFKAPKVSYELTPAGQDASLAIRTWSGVGDVRGANGKFIDIAGRDQDPGIAARAALAATVARMEALLNRQEAGLMKGGEVGRHLVAETLAVRDLAILGTAQKDLLAGRLDEVLEATAVSAVQSITLDGHLVAGSMPVRAAEVKDVLLLTRDAMRVDPTLARDEFLRDRLEKTAAGFQALQMVATLQARPSLRAGDLEPDREVQNQMTYQLGGRPDSLVNWGAAEKSAAELVLAWQELNGRQTA